ncbi:MAG: ferrous iron transport protein A [Oscillospiraceae bacterium]|nr:ferrous iron transport protein A [Oscillospiraceae bacterium]
MLKQGQSGIIKELHGKSAAIRHLEELGFIAGETVRVVSELAGNLIIELKGSRLALNKVTASRIILAD